MDNKQGLRICLSLICLIIIKFSLLCTLYKTTWPKRSSNTKVLKGAHALYKVKTVFCSDVTAPVLPEHATQRSAWEKNCHSHQILTFIFPDLKSSNKRQMTNQDNGYEFLLLLLRRANDDIAKLNLMIIHSNKYLNSFVSLPETKIEGDSKFENIVAD